MIEEQMEKQFNQLGRIADALERLCCHLTGETSVPVGGRPNADDVPVETRGRKKKDALSAAPTPAPAPAPEPEQDIFGDEKPKAALTAADVRSTLKELMDAKGYEAAEKILKTYKVTQLKNLKESDFASVISDAKKELAR